MNNYCIAVNLSASVPADAPPLGRDLRMSTSNPTRPRITEVEQHGIDTIPDSRPHVASPRPVPDPVRWREHLRHRHPRHLPDPAGPVVLAGRRRHPRRGRGRCALPHADGPVRAPDRHEQRGLLRGPLRRPWPHRRLVPVAAHRHRLLLDLGVGQRRRRGRCPRPALRRPRLRLPARRRLRRARRHRHRGGGLRLPVHAAGQQDRRRRQHGADPAGHRRLRLGLRPELRPRPQRLRPGRVLADLRALGADRDGQPRVVRGVPR